MTLFQSTYPSRGTTLLPYLHNRICRFQSTYPSRGTTAKVAANDLTLADFNPHTPRGVRRMPGAETKRDHDFNPHTPRGVRLWEFGSSMEVEEFQSTYPSRGTTDQGDGGGHTETISIHIPLAGYDVRDLAIYAPLINFNPHTPRGVRRKHTTKTPTTTDFNPHTPRGVRQQKQPKFLFHFAKY